MIKVEFTQDDGHSYAHCSYRRSYGWTIPNWTSLPFVSCKVWWDPNNICLFDVDFLFSKKWSTTTKRSWQLGNPRVRVYYHRNPRNRNYVLTDVYSVDVVPVTAMNVDLPVRTQIRLNSSGNPTKAKWIEVGANPQNVKREAVNHPDHYNANPSGVEAIDVIEHLSFNVGNAIKYLWRADHKGKQIEDLKKARWYVDREIQRLSKEDHEQTKSS